MADTQNKRPQGESITLPAVTDVLVHDTVRHLREQRYPAYPGVSQAMVDDVRVVLEYVHAYYTQWLAGQAAEMQTTQEAD